jgi:hypothetical protein
MEAIQCSKYILQVRQVKPIFGISIAPYTDIGPATLLAAGSVNGTSYAVVVVVLVVVVVVVV